MTRGHTLIELALVLAILGMASASLVPAARGYRDSARARAAREAVVAGIAMARGRAVGRGGATFVVSPPARIWVEYGDTVESQVDLEESFGASVGLGGGQAIARLAFDALGLGRVASRTIIVSSGTAEVRLYVSSYGRVRRE